MGLHAAWPLFGLRLRHDDLLLRVVTDDDALVIAGWIPQLLPAHEQHFMPHLYRTMRADSADEMARLELQWIWRQRASLTHESWGISLIVEVDGEPIGVQAVHADGFLVRRQVGSGSFLIAEHRGRGVGTRARAAMLELAFAHLGALTAESGYMEGNDASRIVSERLGYRPNGEAWIDYDGERYREHRMRIDRKRWLTHRPGWLDDLDVEGVEPTRRQLGIASN